MVCPFLVCSYLLQALYILVCHVWHVLAQLIIPHVLTSIKSFILVFCRSQVCGCFLLIKAVLFPQGQWKNTFRKDRKQVSWTPPGRAVLWLSGNPAFHREQCGGLPVHYQKPKQTTTVGIFFWRGLIHTVCSDFMRLPSDEDLMVFHPKISQCHTQWCHTFRWGLLADQKSKVKPSQPFPLLGVGSPLVGVIFCTSVSKFLALLLLFVGSQILALSRTRVEGEGQAGPWSRLPTLEGAGRTQIFHAA